MEKKIKISFVIFLVLSLTVVCSLPAGAVSSSEIENQIADLQKQEEEIRTSIDILETQITGNATEIGQMITEKLALDQQVSLIAKKIDNTQDQISAYSVLIADKQRELDVVEEELKQLHDAYKDRIRAMEENGEISYWAVLFRANSFSDFMDRLNIIQEIAKADRNRLQEIRNAAEAVLAVKSELETRKEALEILKQEQRVSEERLQEKRGQVDNLLAQLLAEGDAFQTLLDKSEEEQQKLMEEIAKLEDAYDEAVYQEWLATYVPPTTEPATTPDCQIPSGSGSWITPVPHYTLTSPFGMRLHPILGIYRLHNGVDMACDEWTPIYASRGGQVSIATNSDSAGLYVQINHGDGYRSVYMHMVHYVVTAGEFVAQGQVIGYVGNTGLSKGHHLHFGISYNGEYVNPMEFIG